MGGQGHSAAESWTIHAIGFSGCFSALMLPPQKSNNQPITDVLRECRKCQIMVILAISHLMKTTAYKYQILSPKVFGQSLELCQVQKAVKQLNHVIFLEILLVPSDSHGYQIGPIGEI